MPTVGFEPTMSAGERPQTYALDRGMLYVVCVITARIAGLCKWSPETPSGSSSGKKHVISLFQAFINP